MSIAAASHSRVFGISQTASKDNIYFIDEGTIAFPAGSNVVVTDIDQKVQRFIMSSDHCDSVSAFTVSADKHMFAVAEKTQLKPIISIYDLHTFRKRKVLNQSTEVQGLSKEFSSLAFSFDTRYLLAQLCGPEWILHYYSWEKGKLLGIVALNPPKPTTKKPLVIESSICPSDGCQLSVVGDTFFRIYRYSEGVLSISNEVLPSLEGESFLCHTWLPNEQVAIGSSNSRILIISGQKTRQSVFLEPAPGYPLPCRVTVIRTTSKGFIAAGHFGTVDIFEKQFDNNTREETYICGFKIPLQQSGSGDANGNNNGALGVPGQSENVSVKNMAVSGTEASLILQTDQNVLYRVLLSGIELKQGSDVVFEHILPPFHHGSVIGLDVCSRKPLIVSCSTDKSVRIWNYLTGDCELCKYFPEEASSVAIHPSGLYILVGFGDKLRLMNVLIDDFRLFKEIGIRACREVCFSNGGHLFAAAHGNMIQLYNVWTFENIGILKGHNGKVRSLYWSPDDSILVSSGTDGAVYSWLTKDLKREGEYILKNCSYTSAVCSIDGKSLYAVGSDRSFKEITESAVSCQLEAGDVLTQVAISNSGRMLFVGTSRGCLRSLKYPLTGESSDFQEHQVHSGSVNRLRISFDDSYLFSASEDGTIYMFKITDRADRGMKKQAPQLFSDEILITKSDLEEKTVTMAELQRSLEELKLEHEYQLRLKDMNFNEKLKDLTEKFTQEIEALKISTSVLRAEKDKEEVKQEEELGNLKGRHLNELHEREAKYNQQLMEEYEKYQSHQNKSTTLQEQWQRQMREYDFLTQRTLGQAQKEAEERLSVKQQEITKLNQQTQLQFAECQEIATQNSEDIDSEIALILGRYEKRLRNERDEGARLKGENGIMRKKFNTLNKDIEDNKSEVLRMKEDERKLRSVIAMLEKEVTSFRKEMSERDELIQDKERRVYELKKKNQELEKFKFVLDFRIKELKEQVEPRETEIAVMTDQIQDINTDLTALHAAKCSSELEIKSLTEKLNATKKQYTKTHSNLHVLTHLLKHFRMQLHDAVQYIQDPPLLIKSVQNMYKEHCAREKDTLVRIEMEPEVLEEYTRQAENLSEEIGVLRKKTGKNMDLYRTDGINSMMDNQALIEEINMLRKSGRRGAAGKGAGEEKLLRRAAKSPDGTKLPSIPGAVGVSLSV